MNRMFLSTGGDPYAHLRKHLSPVPQAAFEGAWATIEIQPDPFARQRFTVGVAVGGNDGRFGFRLLDDLVMFECLYGRDDVGELRALLEEAEHALMRAGKEQTSLADVQFGSASVLLGDLWPTAGTSADVVLDRLYQDVVPFIPREERKARDFITLDNTAVRRIVDDELKRIAGLGFERIRTAPQRAVRDNVTGESHWLEFNLEPPGKAGSVISAVYKTPTNVELNFLRASRDLATYARLKGLRDQQLALFVMTPGASAMPPIDLERLENILWEQSWNLEKQGFVVSSHADPKLLATDVWEWAALAG
jgi:hypothetical protein